MKKYHITYEINSKILYIYLFEVLKEEDMEPVSSTLEWAIGEGKPTSSIVDVTKMRGFPVMSRKVRERLGHMNKKYPSIRRTALVGVSSAARVVAKAIMNLFRGDRKDVEFSFFKTEEEALAWLKEG
ncbi:STAS/SEC14 domain-containing protein [candidate division WOR-3 bacterium]|nr:STAS/SEC14 domain-containing protein [candidate division WOR-3 bacterium]